MKVCTNIATSKKNEYVCIDRGSYTDSFRLFFRAEAGGKGFTNHVDLRSERGGGGKRNNL